MKTLEIPLPPWHILYEALGGELALVSYDDNSFTAKLNWEDLIFEDADETLPEISFLNSSIIRVLRGWANTGWCASGRLVQNCDRPQRRTDVGYRFLGDGPTPMPPYTIKPFDVAIQEMLECAHAAFVQHINHVDTKSEHCERLELWGSSHPGFGYLISTDVLAEAPKPKIKYISSNSSSSNYYTNSLYSSNTF